MERVLFDTDLYIDWLQEGAREELLVGGPFLRYMSTVVLMELRAGAFIPVTTRAVEDLHMILAVTRRISKRPKRCWRN